MVTPQEFNPVEVALGQFATALNTTLDLVTQALNANAQDKSALEIANQRVLVLTEELDIATGNVTDSITIANTLDDFTQKLHELVAKAHSASLPTPVATSPLATSPNPQPLFGPPEPAA